MRTTAIAERPRAVESATIVLLMENQPYFCVCVAICAFLKCDGSCSPWRVFACATLCFIVSLCGKNLNKLTDMCEILVYVTWNLAESGRIVVDGVAAEKLIAETDAGFV